MSERQAPVQDGQTCGVDYTPSAPESPIPEAVRDSLMAIEGVEGVGLAGEGRLRVYVSVAAVQSRLPDRIGDFRVDVEVTGPISFLASEG